jgi:beta-mannanase
MTGKAIATVRQAKVAVLVTATAVLALGFTPAPGAQASIRPQAPLVPAGGALLGSFVDLDNRWTNASQAEQEVSTFESQIGRKVDIDHHYYSWSNPFPTELESWDVADGRTPLISWGGTDLDTIASGSQDSLIAQRADDLKALGATVFVRWCWEMNGDWIGCGGAQQNDPGKTNGPAKYVVAWRHIHDVFTERGATNVVWVWAPNASDAPREPWNHWTQYYPGDDYVHWVGVDGYNWGETATWSKWSNFAKIFSNIYDDYASRKPIMIAETSSAEAGGNKAQWISDAAASLKTTFPSVAAVVWFDVDKETNWRVDSSSAALQSFKAVANDPYFLGQDTGGRSGGGSSGDGDGTRTGGDGADDGPRVIDLTPSPDRMITKTRILFRLPTRARVSIVIRRASTGHAVRHLRTNHRFFPGRHHPLWKGMSDHMTRVKPGRYTVFVKAKRDGRRDIRTARLKVA